MFEDEAYRILEALPQVKQFSIMAPKPITIRWIRSGSQIEWKIMYSIELQSVKYFIYKVPYQIRKKF